jgi:hypothetical protein
MSVELKKFRAERAKLMKGLENVTDETGPKLGEQLNKARSGIGAGFEMISHGIAAAQAAGMTGNTLADYLGHREVQDAVNGVKQMHSEQAAIVGKIQDLHVQVHKVLPSLTKLRDSIDKDLQGRKDKSESKNDIVALGSQIDADIALFKKLGKRAQDLPPIVHDPDKEFNNRVAKILQSAPADLKKNRDDEFLPQQLNTRLLKPKLTAVATTLKQVIEHCAAAQAAAKKNDMAGGRKALADAKAEVKQIADVADEYAAILKRYQDAVAGSKDYKTIVDCVDKMGTAKERAAQAVNQVEALIK